MVPLEQTMIRWPVCGRKDVTVLLSLKLRRIERLPTFSAHLKAASQTPVNLSYPKRVAVRSPPVSACFIRVTEEVVTKWRFVFPVSPTVSLNKAAEAWKRILNLHLWACGVPADTKGFDGGIVRSLDVGSESADKRQCTVETCDKIRRHKQTHKRHNERNSSLNPAIHYEDECKIMFKAGGKTCAYVMCCTC